jgi:hypothetical protein
MFTKPLLIPCRLRFEFWQCVDGSMKTYLYDMSARRWPVTYLMLAVGGVFAGTGWVVDPATNCDESGRECWPILVHVAFWLGVASMLGALSALVQNPRWGSRLDVPRGRLEWWHYAHPARTGAIDLDAVSSILIHEVDEGADKIYFFDRLGISLPFPPSEVIPYKCLDWARDLKVLFPHISVEVQDVL